MKTIQLMMDERDLAEIDRLAKQRRVDRSKLMRAAIKRFLAAAEIEAWEQHDVAVYKKKPLKKTELRPWLEAQVWPQE